MLAARCASIVSRYMTRIATLGGINDARTSKFGRRALLLEAVAKSVNLVVSPDNRALPVNFPWRCGHARSVLDSVLDNRGLVLCASDISSF